jgi:hypothetical protein
MDALMTIVDGKYLFVVKDAAQDGMRDTRRGHQEAPVTSVQTAFMSQPTCRRLQNWIASESWTV